MSLPERGFLLLLEPWRDVNKCLCSCREWVCALGDEGVAAPEWDLSVASVKTPGVTTPLSRWKDRAARERVQKWSFQMYQT